MYLSDKHTPHMLNLLYILEAMCDIYFLKCKSLTDIGDIYLWFLSILNNDLFVLWDMADIRQIAKEQQMIN